MQSNNRTYLLRTWFIAIIPVALSLTACDKLNTLIEKKSPSENASSKVEKKTNQSITPGKITHPSLEQEKKPTDSSKSTALFPDNGSKTSPPAQKKPPAPLRKPSLTERPVENPVYLPLDREITDIAGRKIHVTITARYEKEIALVRKGETKTFNFPIEKLSETDSAFARNLPVSEKPPVVDPFIQREMIRNKHRHDEIAKNRRDITSASLTSSQKRSLMTREKKLLKEIAESEEVIKKLQAKQ